MIYLNNGATSYPKPDCVASATAKALRELPGAANRGGIEDFDVLDEVRIRLAALMGISKHEQIGLGFNATWGLNIAIFGLIDGDAACHDEYGNTCNALLDKSANADIRIVSTKAEHNSVLRPLHVLESRGVRVEYVDTDANGRIDVDVFEAAVKEHRPHLCVFTHASNVTGAANDVARLSAIAKDSGAFTLLDMAQSLGWLDVKLDEWGVDLAAFTGHKYLLGPQGTGGLFVREGIQLTPHLVGGTGIRSDLDTMPDEMPLHIEAGTGNEPSYHGLLAALDWARENPKDMTATNSLLEYLRQELKNLGFRVISPPAPFTPVISFTLEGISPHEIGEVLLDSYDIIVRTGLHCAPKIFECLDVDQSLGTIRVSLSCFTTKEEIDELLEALSDIVSSRESWNLGEF